MSQSALSEQMLTVLDHPLIRTKMTVLRNKQTPPDQFRRTLHEMTGLMSFAVFAHLHTDPVSVDTPLETTAGEALQQPVPCLLSILRAGNGIVDALSALLPDAAVGHLGVQRDPVTHKPIYYCEKLPPEIDKRQVIIADPMLATGGSAIMAADHLTKKGCRGLVLSALSPPRKVWPHSTPLILIFRSLPPLLTGNWMKTVIFCLAWVTPVTGFITRSEAA